MPYQPFNYAGIEPQGNPTMRNLVDNLMKGYSASQLPEDTRLKQEYMAAQTANQRALADEKNLMQDYLRQYLGGGSGGSGGGLDNYQSGGQPSELANAIFRKHFNLPEELPSEKTFRALNEFGQKERMGKEIEQEMGTTGFTTEQQKAKSGIKNALPLLDKLIGFKEPSQFGLNVFSPSKQAEYDAMTAGLTDTLIAALGLPKSNESIALAETMVKRQSRESSDSYHKRLKDLKKDLQKRLGDDRDARDAQIESDIEQILGGKGGKGSKLRTTFSSKEDFQKYRKSLSPAQQQELMKMVLK